MKEACFMACLRNERSACFYLSVFVRSENHSFIVSADQLSIEMAAAPYIWLRTNHMLFKTCLQNALLDRIKCVV